MKKRKRTKRTPKADKVTVQLISLLMQFVIEDEDAGALKLLQDCWPTYDWVAHVADFCRFIGHPMPFAKLLTYPGHAPTWLF